VENLKRRNLRPVVVFIDGTTFGGKGDCQKMLETLVGNQIPVCKISFGDDLGEKLALPAIYFQRTVIPKSFFPLPK
jgi:hypothetical protein